MFKAVILSIEEEIKQREFDALMHLVSSEKQKRINQFYFIRDAWNCLLGDVLTRVELSRTTGLSNNQLEFSTNAYGKPFLTTKTHIHYNISHTGNFIACVLADDPVGIDMELIKPIKMNIAERFFAPDEIEYISSGDFMGRFYEVWTKNEVESNGKDEGYIHHYRLSAFLKKICRRHQHTTVYIMAMMLFAMFVQ